MPAVSRGSGSHADANAGDGPMPWRQSPRRWSNIQHAPRWGRRGCSAVPSRAGTVATFIFINKLTALFFQSSFQRHCSGFPTVVVLHHGWRRLRRLISCGEPTRTRNKRLAKQLWNVEIDRLMTVLARVWTGASALPLSAAGAVWSF